MPATVLPQIFSSPPHICTYNGIIPLDLICTTVKFQQFPFPFVFYHVFSAYA